MDSKLIGRSVQLHGVALVKKLHEEQQEQPSDAVLSYLDRRATSEPEIKDEDFQDKLRTFVAKKSDLLFIPLTHEQKAENKEPVDDAFAIMPPIESFMGIPNHLRREHLYNCIRSDDCITGVIAQILENGLLVRILCVDKHQPKDVEDLDIMAYCPAKELPKLYAKEMALDAFQEKDIIRGIVLTVSAETERIIISLQNKAIPEGKIYPRIGLITEDEFPVHFRRISQIQDMTYWDMLPSILGFNNCGNVTALMEHLNIPDICSYLRFHARLKIPEKEYAVGLKKWQSQKLAHKSVAHGVDMFKQGSNLEAMQHFSRALQIDESNVEALVARGALYANKESFNKAIQDFKGALTVNPKHNNARNYLVETLLAYGKSCEESRQLEDAIMHFEHALKIDPQNAEAKGLMETSNKLLAMQVPSKKEIPTKVRREKIDDGVDKPTGFEKGGKPEASSLLIRSAEKLKQLIKEDEMCQPRKQKKKSRRDSSSSCSSSSSSAVFHTKRQHGRSSSSSDSGSSSGTSSQSDRGRRRKRKYSKSKKIPESSIKGNKNMKVKRRSLVSPSKQKLIKKPSLPDPARKGDEKRKRKKMPEERSDNERENKEAWKRISLNEEAKREDITEISLPTKRKGGDDVDKFTENIKAVAASSFMPISSLEFFSKTTHIPGLGSPPADPGTKETVDTISPSRDGEKGMGTAEVEEQKMSLRNEFLMAQREKFYKGQHNKRSRSTSRSTSRSRTSSCSSSSSYSSRSRFRSRSDGERSRSRDRGGSLLTSYNDNSAQRPTGVQELDMYLGGSAQLKAERPQEDILSMWDSFMKSREEFKGNWIMSRSDSPRDRRRTPPLGGRQGSQRVRQEPASSGTWRSRTPGGFEASPPDQGSRSPSGQWMDGSSTTELYMTQKRKMFPLTLDRPQRMDRYPPTQRMDRYPPPNLERSQRMHTSSDLEHNRKMFPLSLDRHQRRRATPPQQRLTLPMTESSTKFGARPDSKRSSDKRQERLQSHSGPMERSQHTWSKAALHHDPDSSEKPVKQESRKKETSEEKNKSKKTEAKILLGKLQKRGLVSEEVIQRAFKKFREAKQQDTDHGDERNGDKKHGKAVMDSKGGEQEKGGQERGNKVKRERLEGNEEKARNKSVSQTKTDSSMKRVKWGGEERPAKGKSALQHKRHGNEVLKESDEEMSRKRERIDSIYTEEELYSTASGDKKDSELKTNSRALKLKRLSVDKTNEMTPLQLRLPKMDDPHLNKPLLSSNQLTALERKMNEKRKGKGSKVDRDEKEVQKVEGGSGKEKLSQRTEEEGERQSESRDKTEKSARHSGKRNKVGKSEMLSESGAEAKEQGDSIEPSFSKKDCHHKAVKKKKENKKIRKDRPGCMGDNSDWPDSKKTKKHQSVTIEQSEKKNDLVKGGDTLTGEVDIEKEIERRVIERLRAEEQRLKREAQEAVKKETKLLHERHYIQSSTEPWSDKGIMNYNLFHKFSQSRSRSRSKLRSTRRSMSRQRSRHESRSRHSPISRRSRHRSRSASRDRQRRQSDFQRYRRRSPLTRYSDPTKKRKELNEMTLLVSAIPPPASKWENEDREEGGSMINQMVEKLPHEVKETEENESTGGKDTKERLTELERFLKDLKQTKKKQWIAEGKVKDPE